MVDALQELTPGPKGRGRGRGRGRGASAKKAAATLSERQSAGVKQEIVDAKASGTMVAVKGKGKVSRPLKRVSSDEQVFQGGGSVVDPEALQAPVRRLIEAEIAGLRAKPAAPLDQCPLIWWRQHRHEFPHLAIVAQHLLGVPASSVSLEWLFSAAGRATTR